ncbi:hypothetical protein [Granulosicoccus antarcticus]|uniref:Exoglucanase B n=1 Tax=Granulosicoccus antarcticus IMCC3135 TaxID=1192854 RepID=A0A2Z2P251_9GAMM|nr:hypothetical protein [Granulosicoccus antarcticus]ASJ76348.1 Exoglucanase B [Granulosicoccus antarcticus IMCC3135]
MSLKMYSQTAITLLFLSSTALSLPVSAQSATQTQTISPPDGVTAQRYSTTAAEISWARPATFGLRYEVSRDGTLLTNTDGVSYYDQTLAALSSPTYAIVAIDRQGNRSSPSSITVPIRNVPSETLAPPASVTAKRYSDTAAELFWLRSATFGIRYEVSRDGTLLNNISGISYYDSSLGANSSPTYDIVAIDPQGHRSLASSITVPANNPSTVTLAAPSDVIAQRYSSTSAEIFWARPATFGLSYEINRNGTLLGNTNGVSYYDDALDSGESATYSIIAIDRQGQRSPASSIEVPANGTSNPNPVDPLITLDSYEVILKELITLINATPLYDVLSNQPDISDAGITFISIGAEPEEDEVYGLGFVSDYSCDAGGSIEAFNFPEPGSQKYAFTDCALEAGRLNGVLKEFASGSDSSGNTATSFSVDTDEQTKTLSGTNGIQYYRGVAGIKRYWVETSFKVQASESTVTLNSYELDASSAYDPGDSVNNSYLIVSFDVTAPWTKDQNVHVDVTLEASLEPDTAFTWQTGEVVAQADDGSQLTLTPADAVQRTFNLTISGDDNLMSRQWSDGFEILCAYRNIDQCGSF